jgi:hypothetical protein
MRKIFISILIIVSINVYGQNKHLSLGGQNYGICFGNSKLYSGLRFNFIDSAVYVTNGLNLSGSADSKLANGLSIGLLSCSNFQTNGISIGGLISSGSCNGISITGLWSIMTKINGIGISGLTTGDTLNGLMLGFWTIFAKKEINGMALGTFYVHSEKMNGLSISILKNEFVIQKGFSLSIFNETQELHGLQLGLLNHAENNRKIFRWTPLINFNFK